MRCRTQAASLSPLLAAPITVASMSVPLRTNGALGVEIARDRRKEAAVKPMCNEQAAEAHEGGALGRLFIAGKAEKRRKLARSESASASATSERSCNVASNSALNIAKGGHAFSPLADGESGAMT